MPPSRLQPKIARDLETICLKCLQKEPRRRYGSAEELADDLRRYLDGRPIHARRTPLWERGAKWARRHPTTATLLGLGAAAVVTLAAVGLRYDARRKADGGARTGRVACCVPRCDQEALRGPGPRWRRRTGSEAQLILTNLLTALKPERRLKPTAQPGRRAARPGRATGIQADEDAGARTACATNASSSSATRRSSSRPSSPGSTCRRTCKRPAPRREGAGRLRRRPARATPGPCRRCPPRCRRSERAEIVEGCYELLLILAEAVAQALPGEDPKQQAERGLQILDRAARLRPGVDAAYHLPPRRLPGPRWEIPAGEARELAEAERLRPTTALDHFLAGQERFQRRRLERGGARLRRRPAAPARSLLGAVPVGDLRRCRRSGPRRRRSA